MLKSLLAGLLMTAATASGATTVATYTNGSAFVADLDQYTAINTAPLAGSYINGNSFAGGSFFGPTAYVRSGGWIENGDFFYNAPYIHVGLNFTTAVNAVGVWSNPYDGGQIEFYSGLNGTGTLLGTANFGDGTGNVTFGAGIIDGLAQSAVFTCLFNYDLACVVASPTFGLSEAALPAVPLPAGLPLAAGGLFALGLFGRKNRRVVAN